MIYYLLEFEGSYNQLGPDIACYGGPDWNENQSVGQNDGKFGNFINRSTRKGSPVVPASVEKILEEGDSILYSMVILRGHSTAGSYEGELFRPGLY